METKIGIEKIRARTSSIQTRTPAHCSLCSVTVLEAVNKGTEFLARKNVESARLQSELLLAHLLRVPRLNLYLNFERAVTAEEQDQYRTLLQARGQRRPLQHILGAAHFYGLELNISNAALVPRPETEILVSEALRFLKERGPSRVLDWGTGSGCIALAIASNQPEATVLAIDQSASAIELASGNAEKLRLSGRVEFRRAESYNFSWAERFDLIVSNPPYIPSAEIDHLEPEVRDHDPREALDGGADGLTFYRLFAEKAAIGLRPDGMFMGELGDGQAGSVQDLFRKGGWTGISVVNDLNQIPRVLMARPPESQPTNDQH